MLDAAAEAWLDRALDRAPPVMLDTRVVEPMVVSKVLVPSVAVDTMGAVRVVSGIEVAPATPLMPEMVVSPVTVLVTEPLVIVEVKVLVEMAVASPDGEAVTVTTEVLSARVEAMVDSETVETKVVSMVWPSLVMVETTWVVTGLTDSETVATTVVSIAWPSLVTVETT